MTINNAHTTPNDAIIARIKKVMALQAGATTEGEAAAAAARIQDMLTEHNLTMAAINRATVSPAGPARAMSTHDKATMYEYQKRLMNGVAEAFFCVYFRQSQWREDKRARTGRRFVKVHVLVGREENVTSAQLMYDYLTDTMDRLLPWQGMEKRGKMALAWLDGCSERLVERLESRRRQQEQARAEQAAANQEQGLILLSDVYSSEYDDNMDVYCGRPVGTTRAHKATQAAETARIQALEDDFVAKGASRDDAWYLARGYEVPRVLEDTARDEVRRIARTETPAQKARREEREEREWKRTYDRWAREEARKEERRNHPAYKSDMETGSQIGLDVQISTSKPKGVL